MKSKRHIQFTTVNDIHEIRRFINDIINDNFERCRSHIPNV